MRPGIFILTEIVGRVPIVDILNALLMMTTIVLTGHMTIATTMVIRFTVVTTFLARTTMTIAFVTFTLTIETVMGASMGAVPATRPVTWNVTLRPVATVTTTPGLRLVRGGAAPH